MSEILASEVSFVKKVYDKIYNSTNSSQMYMELDINHI